MNGSQRDNELIENYNFSVFEHFLVYPIETLNMMKIKWLYLQHDTETLFKKMPILRSAMFFEVDSRRNSRRGLILYLTQ